MIVLVRSKVARSGPKFAGHAEMNAEPEVSGEPKEHLLAASLRVEQALPNEF